MASSKYHSAAPGLLRFASPLGPLDSILAAPGEGAGTPADPGAYVSRVPWEETAERPRPPGWFVDFPAAAAPATGGNTLPSTGEGARVDMVVI